MHFISIMKNIRGVLTLLCVCALGKCANLIHPQGPPLCPSGRLYLLRTPRLPLSAHHHLVPCLTNLRPDDVLPPRLPQTPTIKSKSKIKIVTRTVPLHPSSGARSRVCMSPWSRMTMRATGRRPTRSTFHQAASMLLLVDGRQRGGSTSKGAGEACRARRSASRATSRGDIAWPYDTCRAWTLLCHLPSAIYRRLSSPSSFLRLDPGLAVCLPSPCPVDRSYSTYFRA